MLDHGIFDVILVDNGEMQLANTANENTLRMKTMSISSQARAMRYGISENFRLVTTVITRSAKIVPTKHGDGVSTSLWMPSAEGRSSRSFEQSIARSSAVTQG